jgi:hypothetical protein
MKMSSSEPKAPGDLIIATSADRILVRIQPDGTITYGPDYTPDEAATVLWRALAKQRVEAVEREALMGHIEHMMVKLGEQDLLNERYRIQANSDAGTPHDKFQAERAHQQLEVYVHQVLELARSLALRDRKPVGPPGTVLN